MNKGKYLHDVFGLPKIKSEKVSKKNSKQALKPWNNHFDDGGQPIAFKQGTTPRTGNKVSRNGNGSSRKKSSIIQKLKENYQKSPIYAGGENDKIDLILNSYDLMEKQLEDGYTSNS